ncbi:MAG: ATP-binding cassette domain-containing protein, partial [Bacteroidales bacterium]
SDLALRVPQGAIFGYLGENGSGKTTSIQLLLGLIGNRKNITICGKNIENETERIAMYRKVGSLIAPFFVYEHLTCLENLQYLNQFYHKSPIHLQRILQQIGLTNEQSKKVKYISTGMRQRLAIGLSLVNEPELLILDEPINGLDPVGIHAMRELFSDLHEQGKTIFMSTHILSEIEKICTHIGVLHKGSLLYQGELSALKKENNMNNLEEIYLQMISHADVHSFDFNFKQDD